MLVGAPWASLTCNSHSALVERELRSARLAGAPTWLPRSSSPVNTGAFPQEDVISPLVENFIQTLYGALGSHIATLL